MEEAKEAPERDAICNGGRGKRQPIEDLVVNVIVHLTSNTLTVAEWARNQGITTVHVTVYEERSGGQFAASVPLSLMGALATQEGVREIKPIREATVGKE